MKLILTTLALGMALSSLASVKILEEVYVMGMGPEVVRELVESGSIEIDHVSSKGFEVYGPKGLMDYLDTKNVPYLDMLAINKMALSDYPSHEEITRRLKAAEAKNPGIIKVFSIGQSVKGRELWVAKISDNVDIDEVEPEFKYISSMHGDEITGRELTVLLIEEIAEKYGHDQEFTDLVNNTEIYIMPSMNPDGSAARRRANAKGVDLNRNFPDIIRDRASNMAGREIETQAMMKFQASRKFALSANFHGGAIVANYPWDSKHDLHPLDSVVKEFSQIYSAHNPEMRSSSEFPGGITNGAAWYVVRGGMQDWSYFWFNDLQITLEVSQQKWPPFSKIPGFYHSNRDSMVEYMKLIHQGAGIKFEKKGVSGTVAIKQVSPMTKDMGTYSFSESEFYKVLPEGSYIFTVTGTAGTKSVELRVERGFVFEDGNYVTL